MSEIRKIAVTGPPCSGKSTVLRDFVETFDGHAVVAEEQARILLEGVPVEERSTIEQQYRLVAAIEVEEERAARRGLPVLCDRSVLDGVAYLRNAGRREEAEALFDHIRFWLPTYERFVVCSPEGIPYEQDGVRTEPPEFRDSLYRHLIETFNDYGIEFDLLTGSREERHERIVAIVREGRAYPDTVS